ncbi:MAG: hypothetical protein K9M99_03280 [Candidatus Cloacimonetes bacterium]|nr:hypothetical protein [Candidatus Cloacimonadota bacterium]
MNSKVILIFVILTFSLSALSAEGLDQTLEKLSGTAAEMYVGPIVSGFGTNLNGGWFHKSPKSKFLGLDFEIGIVGMGTMFNDEDDNFSTNAWFQFVPKQAEDLTTNIDPNIRPYVIKAILEQEFLVNMYGPTIIGSSAEEIEIDFPAQYIDWEAPDGSTGSELIPGQTIGTDINGILDGADALPFFAPQIAIGTLFGTMLTARILPAFDVKDLGEVSYYGGGLQHNIKAWMPLPIPVDISLAAFMQTLKLGEYVTANAFTAGINVSKTFGPEMFSITPYAGYMLENSNMEFSYDFLISEEQDPVKINFDIDGKNKSRLTLGSTFRLGITHFNIDYNVGEYKSVTIGLAFAF